MKAQDFLRKGADLLEERGKQYDQPGGERSMGKAIRAFNTITGRSLYESEGWLLLQILKDVRQWQNPDKYHADSAEDCVSYAALKAESLQAEQFLLDGWTDETIKAASFAHGGPISSDDVYLVGEQFDDFGAPLPVEPESAIDDDSARMHAIGQNVNDGSGSGWIESDGVRSPHTDESVMPIELLHRDGSSSTVSMYVVMRDDEKQGYWKHTGSPCDIIAYRPTKEA